MQQQQPGALEVSNPPLPLLLSVMTATFQYVEWRLLLSLNSRFRPTYQVQLVMIRNHLPDTRLQHPSVTLFEILNIRPTSGSARDICVAQYSGALYMLLM